MTQLGTNLSLSLSLSAAAADWQGVLATTVVAKHIPSAPGARNSTIILDTGKNHAGTCRFKLQGQAGGKVVMRCASFLYVSLVPLITYNRWVTSITLISHLFFFRL